MKVTEHVLVIPVEPKKLSKTDPISCIFNNTQLDCLTKFLPKLGILPLLLSRCLFFVLIFITFQMKQTFLLSNYLRNLRATEKTLEIAGTIDMKLATSQTGYITKLCHSKTTHFKNLYNVEYLHLSPYERYNIFLP
jgi:hypothetical protein